MCLNNLKHEPPKNESATKMEKVKSYNVIYLAKVYFENWNANKKFVNIATIGLKFAYEYRSITKVGFYVTKNSYSIF